MRQNQRNNGYSNTGGPGRDGQDPDLPAGQEGEPYASDPYNPDPYAEM